MHVLNTCMCNPDLHWSWWNSCSSFRLSFMIIIFISLSRNLRATFFVQFHNSFLLAHFAQPRKAKIQKKKHITKSMRNALSVPSSVEPIIHSHAFLILLLMLLLLLFVVFIRFGDISTVIPHNRLYVCVWWVSMRIFACAFRFPHSAIP